MSAFSFVPDGTGLVCWTLYPAINGWAIFIRGIIFLMAVAAVAAVAAVDLEGRS